MNDAPFTPHDSISRAEFARQFYEHETRWRKAFDFLRDTDLNALPPGEYPIDGKEVFAIVAEAAKKDFAETKWGSHQIYQDIQMVTKGGEQIGVAPISALNVTEPSDETKDVGFYFGEGTIYTAEPHVFLSFFLPTGIVPTLKFQESNVIKKSSLKLKPNRRYNGNTVYSD